MPAAIIDSGGKPVLLPPSPNTAPSVTAGGDPVKYCFNWGGQWWGGTYPGWAAFKKYLESHGDDPNAWIDAHAAAAKCIGASKSSTTTPPSPTAGAGGLFAPCEANPKYLRNDQGLDVVTQGPLYAITDGTITDISGGWSGGTGIGVYLTFDLPVTVLGRSYSQQYIAEGTPVVKVGQPVKGGQPLVKAGSIEMGFWPSPLVGGTGAGTKPTKQSYDFAFLCRSLGVNLPDSALGPDLTGSTGGVGGVGGGGGTTGGGNTKQPAGVVAAWRNLVGFHATTVPAENAKVKAVVAQIQGVWE